SAIAVTPCSAMALASSRYTVPEPPSSSPSESCRGLRFSLRGHQQPEQSDPDDEQEMPVRRAKTDAHIGPRERDRVARIELSHSERGACEHEQAADEVQPMHRGEQNEERVRGRLGGV